MIFGWDAWITIGIIFLVFILLVRNLAPTDVVMLSAAVFLGLSGILTVEEVFAGFVNPGVLTIAALFVVAAAMRETGVLDSVGERLLGKAHEEKTALFRLGATVLPMSAFLNNTPVVAMLVPVLNTWCRNNNLSPSRVLIPLSYLAILGGACTLIGTSTTIVVDSLIKRAQLDYLALANAPGIADAAAEAYRRTAAALTPIGMFEITVIGVPFALIGWGYLMTFGRRLLPDRREMLQTIGQRSKQYMVEMCIESGCRLIGRSVELAGLRHLPGLFLVEIVRDGKTVAPVRPDEVLQEHDILTFTGVVDTIVDLERIPGLVPYADAGYEAESVQRREKSLCEAVISATSPLIGVSVRDADFRAVYNAAVVAVHRAGKRLRGRVGDVVLQHGDTLLLQVGPHFVRAHRNNPDFYLVGGIEESRAVRTDKAAIALTLMVLLVVLLSLSQPMHFLEMPLIAAGIAGLMILFQCISPGVARQSLDWSTLATIAGAIALGKALDKTGVASAVAGGLVDAAAGLGPHVVLAIIYVATAILTESVTTKGAAVLMFPIAVATAHELGLSPRPFAFAVLLAAALSFVTPLGFQTNLMVYGAGGYRFSDYIRVGLPLALVLAIAATLMIPIVWPFVL